MHCPTPQHVVTECDDLFYFSPTRTQCPHRSNPFWFLSLTQVRDRLPREANPQLLWSNRYGTTPSLYKNAEPTLNIRLDPDQVYCRDRTHSARQKMRDWECLLANFHLGEDESRTMKAARK